MHPSSTMPSNPNQNPSKPMRNFLYKPLWEVCHWTGGDAINNGRTHSESLCLQIVLIGCVTCMANCALFAHQSSATRWSRTVGIAASLWQLEKRRFWVLWWKVLATCHTPVHPANLMNDNYTQRLATRNVIILAIPGGYYWERNTRTTEQCQIEAVSFPTLPEPQKTNNHLILSNPINSKQSPFPTRQQTPQAPPRNVQGFFSKQTLRKCWEPQWLDHTWWEVTIF